MTNYVTLITVAALGGIAVSFQGQFMGLMDQRLGTKASVFITYASGGLVAALAVLLSGGWTVKGWQNVPWYAFSAGLLGLLIVGTISYTVPRLGLTRLSRSLWPASSSSLHCWITSACLGPRCGLWICPDCSGSGFLFLVCGSS